MSEPEKMSESSKMSDPRNWICRPFAPCWRNRTGANTGAAWKNWPQTDAFQDLMHREFPRQASRMGGWRQPPQFSQAHGRVAGAGGLDRLHAAAHRVHHPYVRQPEELVPGRPLFYATAMPLGASSTGLLVESHEGRPTKIEGNPEHPEPGRMRCLRAGFRARAVRSRPLAGAGATKARYAPGAASWELFSKRSRCRRPSRAPGCAFSPRRSPRPRWRTRSRAYWRRIRAPSGINGSPPGRTRPRPERVWRSGSPSTRMYDLRGADVIVSLDADFLASGPGSLRYARQFAARRRVRGGQTDMNRLYVVEPMPTPTGTKADHRLPLRAADVEQFAWSLAAALGADTGGRKGAPNAAFDKWIGADRARPAAASRREPGDRRRAARPGGPRAGARMNAAAGQCGQDRSVHRAGGSQSGRSGRLAIRSGEGSGCRRGGSAVDSGRQSGLQRAGRAGLPRSPEEGRSARPSEPARRRDLRALPLALAHDSLPGDMERLPCARWHGHHHAALDRSALCRKIRARSARHAHRASRSAPGTTS